MTLVRLSVLVVSALASTGAAAQPVSPFVIVNLGTLGGGYSRAVTVNESGEVVGWSATATGDEHAFIWAPATGMLDLGTLGGRDSEPYAISDGGQVVGFSYTRDDAEIHAFSWTAESGMVDLGVIGRSQYGGSGGSVATAVSERGQVVGGASTAIIGHAGHAFSWTRSGGMVDLGTLGGTWSGATDVNESGQIVGSSEITAYSGVGHAFLWTSTSGMVDLGALDGAFGESGAVGINDNGQVIGWSDIRDASGTRRHAFSWTSTEGMVDLGSLGDFDSEAIAVNAGGQVVGNAYTPNSRDPSQAFSWTATGGIVDLGNLGRLTSEARAVNDDGQVVGMAYTPANELHAYSWTITGGMVDLHMLGGSWSIALAVNRFGEIVGGSDTEGGTGSGNAVMWLNVESAAARLVDMVSSYGLSPGLTNALGIKIQHAIASWRHGDRVAAAEQLHALVVQVRAQRGKALTNTQANEAAHIAEILAFSINNGTALP